MACSADGTKIVAAAVGEIAGLNSHVVASFISPCWRRADAEQEPALHADGISSYQRITDRPVPEGSAITCWVHTAVAENKPWDAMAREILCPNADDEKTRNAALFYVRRLEKVGQNPTDYPGLTRDLGRLFMGVDLKCAQCHNHKYIKDYKQADFQGLFAFIGQTYIRSDIKTPAIGESCSAPEVRLGATPCVRKCCTSMEPPTVRPSWIETTSRSRT